MSTSNNGRLPQPFIDGLKEYPVGRQKDLAKLRSWLKTQPHLPEISDEYCYLFLHGCYYHQDVARKCIEIYFTLRTRHPEIFQNRDAYSPEMQKVLALGNLCHLPKKTPEGYQVLMYSIKDNDYRKFVFADAVKGFAMYNDCLISEHGLADGYIVIVDMKGVTIGHLARVAYAPIKAFILYAQEGHPARLKGVHVLNTVPWIHHVMKIVVPLVKQDYLNYIKFHKGSVPDGFPIELLPSDYGGQQPSIAELDAHCKSMVAKYAQWLRETEVFQVDESKRPKKQSWWDFFSGITTRNVPMDKETFLKTLQLQ